MSQSEEYSIPVPGFFRVPPLAQLPWGISSVPGLLCHRDGAEERLRAELCTAYGVKHCILTDSARSAYALYIRARGLTGEVIMQSFMHTPTAVLFMNHGLDLCFSDVADDYNMTVDTIAPLVSETTRAIMVTHMFGKTAPIDEIEAWAAPRNIQVLSNMVHMHPGVSLGERPLASYGDVAFVSFNMDKPLHGLYGGALLTNSDSLYEAASALPLRMPTQKKILTLLARYLLLYRYKPLLGPLQYLAYRAKGDYFEKNDVAHSFNSVPADDYEGFKPSAMHPWQAAFMDQLLGRAATARAHSEAKAARVCAALADVPEVEAPEPGARPHTYLYYPILIDGTIERYALGCALARRGVEAKWRYYPLHLQPKFAHFRTGDLSNTLSRWNRYLLLPVLYGSERDADYVVQALKESLQEVAGSGS